MGAEDEDEVRVHTPLDWFNSFVYKILFGESVRMNVRKRNLSRFHYFYDNKS